jgi:hypothetical protein
MGDEIAQPPLPLEGGTVMRLDVEDDVKGSENFQPHSDPLCRHCDASMAVVQVEGEKRPRGVLAHRHECPLYNVDDALRIAQSRALEVAERVESSPEKS